MLALRTIGLPATRRAPLLPDSETQAYPVGPRLIATSSEDQSSVLSGCVRNIYGVSPLLALAFALVACGSEPNLIVGESVQATQPTVQATAAVADDSAPFEVVPDAGGFVETADAVNINDHPLLRYLEPNTHDRQHPGRAQFVLIDSDGEPARLGSAQFPLSVIGLSGYAGENVPIEYVLSYNNFNQNEFGEIGYGRCRGSWGHFAQQSSTNYQFRPGQYPTVKDLAFDEDSMECGEMPPLTPANIFDGTVELEFDETDITVVSQDGERWMFRQIPIRPGRQRIVDAQPTTTAAATTTTAAATTTTVVDGD